MKIHEYQAKELLRAYGVPVLEGRVAVTPAEARAVARDLGGDVVVVKAQIHAGGRGKGQIRNPDGSGDGGGGVRLAHSPEEAEALARAILGNTLVTHQTGPEGRVVRKVLVEAGCDVAQELYLGAVVDRESGRVTLIASREGGVEIERVAAERPEAILRHAVDPVTGLLPFGARKLAYGLGLEGEAAREAVRFMLGLYRLFAELDASLAEINPLVVTRAGRVVALDAKINLDDNALFRHRDLAELRDPDEEDPRETEAKKYDLSYVGLEGSIGCMVNGAGLAMATMDIIKHHGGEPANFLDVGGGADREKVTAAFKLILADRHVKAVLVNIFGGIMRCDVIAEGVVAAVKEIGIEVPLIVRLEGTKVEEGRQILEASGLAITFAGSMAEGARLAVEAVA